MTARSVIAVAVVAWLCLGAGTTHAQRPPADDGITVLVEALQRSLQAGDADEYLALVSPDADRTGAEAFVRDWLASPVTRAVVRERIREPLPAPPADRYALFLDVFTERGDRGRVGTWRLEVVGRAGTWRIASQTEVSALGGLYRLRLDPARHLVGENLRIEMEDLRIEIPHASVFVADVPAGPTAVVILGDGQMTFAPPSDPERRQVEIFSGDPAFHDDVDAVFLRVHPDAVFERVRGTLREQPADPDRRRRASILFEDAVGKSFGFDLRDLSSDLWSIVPPTSDVVAEIRTDDHGTLTYSRLRGSAEDISLVDRERRWVISQYASAEVLAERGPDYSEDDRRTVDVLHYDVEARFDPERSWLDGRTTLRLQVIASGTDHLDLRLARTLTFESVVSPQLGRLLAVRGNSQQGSFLVRLPDQLPQGAVFDVTVAYQGRLLPSRPTREALTAQFDPEGGRPGSEDPFAPAPAFPPEPNWLFSNDVNWYVQSIVSDYAPARLRLSVPERYAAVASGLAAGPPETVHDPVRGIRWRQSTFVAARPVRYLSWVISRFRELGGDRATLPRSDPPTPVTPLGYQAVDLHTVTVPRQEGVARQLTGRARDILEYYGSLVGEFPYPALTLALVESDLPGGHSPPYLVQMHQPPPLTPNVWRNDPVYVDDVPEFFLAHELAHQWWGQAVGWKNFHEQWLSEGLAQYFALLYVEARHPEEAPGVLRQLRRWSLRESEHGPVYLGYRLGHLEEDPRVFRALVYNKGAAVLHMLRRTIGDPAFFQGLRRFYHRWRFTKAGTEDLRAAFEAEAGRPLDRFFAGWIYGQEIPRIGFSWQPDGDGTLVLRFQYLGESPDVPGVPVTVTVRSTDGSMWDRVIDVNRPFVEVRLPVSAPVRDVRLNDDHAALAEFID